MRLLLDTHIWLWSLLAPDRLIPRVASEIGDPDNELWLSPISIWETMVLSQKGRIQLGQDASAWIREALRRVQFQEAALNFEVALRSALLALRHPDPADRFLLATAAVYDLTFVTGDELLLSCGEVSILANR